MKNTVKTVLESLKFASTGVLGNIYRILIANLERSNETIDKIEDLSKIPGFSKAILRNIKKESDRMQASSESEEEEIQTNIKNAKRSKKRNASSSPDISIEKEHRKKKPRKAARRSSSSSSSTSSSSLPEPEAHRVRCKVCKKWLLPSEMRQHMKIHK